LAQNPKGEYSREEAEQRLRSAILGARAVGYRPLKSITRETIKTKRKRRVKNAASANAKTS
jgi:hypothetical protein